jgi:hypothetical protein
MGGGWVAGSDSDCLIPALLLAGGATIWCPAVMHLPAVMGLLCLATPPPPEVATELWDALVSVDLDFGPVKGDATVGQQQTKVDPPELPAWHNQPWNYPKIHYTPSCYRAGAGPHDIAAALVTADGTQHLFPGCWRTAGGLQHIVSHDWVHWTPHQVLADVRTSGGMALDDNGTAVFIDVGGNSTYWHARFRAANDSTLAHFGAPEDAFTETNLQGGPGDPVRPWRRGGRWYTALALSACNDRSKWPNATQGGWDCPLGALEDLWSSEALRGPAANWRHEGPLLSSNESYLPWRGVQWEYVTPDYFAGLPGDPHPHGSDAETYPLRSNLAVR